MGWSGWVDRTVIETTRLWSLSGSGQKEEVTEQLNAAFVLRKPERGNWGLLQTLPSGAFTGPLEPRC